MKDLTQFLVTQVVDNPNEVNVSQTEDGHGSITITIKVAADDMGKVIGKHGKIIQAIRRLIKVKAIKENKHVNVVLAE